MVICQQHAKKKQRVRVVEYWIETARECFNIGNFNSLMAIIAGLNMSPISRLKKTVSLWISILLIIWLHLILYTYIMEEKYINSTFSSHYLIIK